MDSKDEGQKVVDLEPDTCTVGSKPLHGNAKVRKIGEPRRARRAGAPPSTNAAGANSVTSLQEFRAAREQGDKATLQMLDEATRDVLAAASTALKLVTLARLSLGLDQDPRK